MMRIIRKSLSRRKPSLLSVRGAYGAYEKEREGEAGSTQPTNHNNSPR